jgi:hypothetical protein
VFRRTPERTEGRNSEIDKMNEKGIQRDVTVNRKIMEEKENERRHNERYS